TAVKLGMEGDHFVGKELWSNKETSVQFNTPVLKGGLLFGLSQGNEFFCMNAQHGKPLWTAPVGPTARGRGGPGARLSRGRASLVGATGVLSAGNELGGKREGAVQFNGPVLKGGVQLGLSRGEDCVWVAAQHGNRESTPPVAPARGAGGGARGRMGGGGRGF